MLKGQIEFLLYVFSNYYEVFAFVYLFVTMCVCWISMETKNWQQCMPC